ncbi:tRNA-splicing endonuclease subunit Sen2-like [Anopheles albimanus]|uniref:tRNA-intron lyase n=1 Tax=Anopheles albimanus TaxID=7167 RepID=A0A182F573_ANOAL|nr:tRNA-splicing endonuclease subunit Sen2-like [Anopheles albimanus]
MAAKGTAFVSNLRPKRKVCRELSHTFPLPVFGELKSEDGQIEGLFTGFSVEVVDPDSIRNLCLNGGFGQGLFSRSFPACITNSSETNRRRKRPVASSPPTIHPAGSQEPLSLFLEEAFFLMHKLNILRIKTISEKELSVSEAFTKFRNIKKDFVACYCAYLYLKSKNWVVKCGLKFGGDFVIYVRGPQFYHASYIVLIEELAGGKPLKTHTVDGLDFQGFNRIAETTAKDILFLEVHYPEGFRMEDNLHCLERLRDVRVGEKFTKHHNIIAARTQT